METTVTTSNAFYQASGSSPPVEGDAALLPELIDDLARLLADALLADIRQYPNLAALQPNLESTVESPSGLDRRVACTAPAPGIEGPAMGSDRINRAARKSSQPARRPRRTPT
jgi:hypothetical protein